jgi:hypothetical protein
MQGDAAGGGLSGTYPNPTLGSGSNSYIQNSDALQSGSTFYTSSGTVSGQLTTGSQTMGTSYTMKVGQTSSGNSGMWWEFLTSPPFPGDYLFLRASNTTGAGLVKGFNFEDGSNRVGMVIDPTNAARFAGMRSTGSFRFYDGTNSHFDAFVAPNSLSANTTWTLPSTDFNGIWQSNGNGTLSISSNTLITSPAGHRVTIGNAPTVSSCGTSPSGSVVGDDNQGIITVGGGVVTACTLTFASSWGVTPVCTISDNSTAITGDISSLSATGMTTSFSASFGGGLVYYQCGCSGTSCT